MTRVWSLRPVLLVSSPRTKRRPVFCVGRISGRFFYKRLGTSYQRHGGPSRVSWTQLIYLTDTVLDCRLYPYVLLTKRFVVVLLSSPFRSLIIIPLSSVVVIYPVQTLTDDGPEPFSVRFYYEILRSFCLLLTRISNLNLRVARDPFTSIQFFIVLYLLTRRR